MKKHTKFSKASIWGLAAISTAFTACDLINEIPTEHGPGEPQTQISSSSYIAPISSSTANLTTQFETWRGTDGEQRIITGADNGTETSGYWFHYADDADGGASRIIWPVQEGDEYNPESLQPIVEHCNGVCGTASLRKGNLTYNPFTGVGFTFAGESPSGYLDAADASNMGGVCVSYASEAAMNLEMGFSDEVNARLGYANPVATLPRSYTGTTKFIPWSSFKQPAWYKGDFKLDGTDGAKQLVSLRFLIQASAGDYKFNITEVGSLNACTGVPASINFETQEIQPPEPPQPPQPPQPPVLGDHNFETWFGYEGSSQIKTGYGNETETEGYWYTFADDADGGASEIIWPVAIGNEYNADALEPVIEHCNGLCGTAVLNKGILTYNPFAGVGFNLVGEASATDLYPLPANALGMGGICITYTSDAAPTLEMKLGDLIDASIGYANPAVSLPKSTTSTTKFIPWSSFKQPSWYKGSTQLTGEQAAQQLVAITFKIQAAPGSYNFNIKAFGAYDGACAPAAGN